MFRLLFCTFPILCLLLAGPGEAAPAPAQADIYPSGIRVLFTVPFAEDLQFDLPGAFDEGTVRILPSGDQTIEAFAVATAPRTKWVPPALAGLHERLMAQESAVAEIKAKIAAIDQSVKLLTGPLPEGIGSQEVPGYVDALRIAREKLETERIPLTVALTEATEVLSVIRQEYSAGAPENPGQVVTVTARMTGSGNITVEAWSSHAGWSPMYRMDARSGTGDVAAELKGSAWQRTGLDFDVPLLLHTKMPLTSGRPPKLRPLVVDFREERMTRQAFDSMPAGAMLSIEAPREKAANAPQVIQTATNLSVKAEGRLPGSGAPAEFSLGTFDMKADLQILLIPELSGVAWITAKVEELSQVLLPGGVALSVDGTPSRNTSIREHGAGTPFELAFGMMPLVRGEKKPFVSKGGSSWMGKGHLEDGYTLDVVNGSDKKLTVTLMDRLPVSAQEKIVVETVKLEPKPTDTDKENLMTWKFDMEPGEKKTVEVLYKLTYPGGKELEFR